MSDLGAEVDSSWEACTAAGRRLRAAAMERRGDTARRAMADMICWRCGWRFRRWHSQDRSFRYSSTVGISVVGQSTPECKTLCHLE